MGMQSVVTIYLLVSFPYCIVVVQIINVSLKMKSKRRKIEKDGDVMNALD